MQLEDLLRHGGHSKHQDIAPMHRRALDWLSQQSGQKSNGGSAEGKTIEIFDGPTPAQFRLALEVCRSPLGAMGNEYERRNELASRGDPKNFPPSHDSRRVFWQIVQSIAEALLERQRKKFDKGVSKALLVGLAEDQFY